MLINPGKLLTSRVSNNSAKKLLNQINLGYLFSNCKYMFYPNDPSRTQSDRDYLYENGWKDLGTLSRNYLKNRLNQATNLIVTDAAGILGPNGQIEPTRTNLAYPSIPPALAAGNIVFEEGAGAGTENDEIAPDGTKTATKYISTRAGYTLDVFPLPVSPGDEITISLWLKGDGEGFTIGCYDITHSVIIGTTPITVTSEWARHSATFTIPDECTSVLAYPIKPVLAGPRTFWIWGLNIEIGAYPSTLISTTSDVVTRTADSLNYTGLSGLSPEGGLVAVFRRPYTTAKGVVHACLNLDDSSNNAIYIYTWNDGHIYINGSIEGTGFSDIDLGVPTTNEVVGVALDWDSSGVRAAINGVDKAPYVATLEIPAFNQMPIGKRTSSDIPDGCEHFFSAAFNKKFTSTERINLSTLGTIVSAGL